MKITVRFTKQSEDMGYTLILEKEESESINQFLDKIEDVYTKVFKEKGESE